MEKNAPKVVIVGHSKFDALHALAHKMAKLNAEVEVKTVLELSDQHDLHSAIKALEELSSKTELAKETVYKLSEIGDRVVMPIRKKIHPKHQANNKYRR